MAFTIPNLADAFHADQAEPDKVDVDILVAGYAGSGVVSGCAVTAQGTPDMTVAVAAGTVVVAGVTATVAAGNVTITAAHATNPRFDLITVNNSGTKACTAGTAAAEPVFPAIPASSVVLAAVYVPAADTTIASNQIVDKRVNAAQAFDADLALVARRVAARRTTDSAAVNNSIVLVDDTQLVLALEANTTYMFTAVLTIASSTTADFRLRLSGPTGASGSFGASGSGANGPTIALGVDSGPMSAAAATVMMIDGFVTVAGTAGNLTLAWAQGTATAVDTKVLIGSWMIAEPLA